jgi:hypothetical protein
MLCEFVRILMVTIALLVLYLAIFQRAKLCQILV